MAKQHKCPLCGHEIQLSPSAVKPRDLIAENDRIHWRYEDEEMGTDVGGALGESVKSLAESIPPSMNADIVFYAVEVAAALLAPKLGAVRDGGWRWESDSAVKKAKSAIVVAANNLLNSKDPVAAILEAAKSLPEK